MSLLALLGAAVFGVAMCEEAKTPAEPQAPKIEKLTLKDGRVLEGVFDAEQGKLKLYSKAGRAMGAIDLKEEEIEAREVSSIVLNEAPPAPKETRTLTEEEKLEAQILNLISTLNKAKESLAATLAEKKRHHDQYSGKQISDEEMKRYNQRVQSFTQTIARLEKEIAASNTKYAELKEAYAKAGGKRNFDDQIKH